ncbi:flagellar basal body L-ring protein FlgH [Thermovibrio sp.]
MQSRKGRFGYLFIGIVVLCSLTSCVHKKEEVVAFPEAPPPEYEAPKPSPGSLFSGYENLFSDPKARNVGDVITIKVYENISGSGSAKNTAQKKSSYDINVNKPVLFGKKFPGKSKDPLIGFSTSPSSSFSGKGATSRNAKLIATITVRVVKVYPNGDLYVVGKKVIKINDEYQVLKISGIVRPSDIEPDNSVPSSKVADMYVEYNGKGYFNESSRPGWLARFLSKIWPF